MATKQPKSTGTYTADSVQHLAGRDAVRAKTSMYLGDPGPECVFTCVREVADNVVDEALGGHASACLLYVDEEDGSYWIADNGRGIPVGDSTVTDAITNKKVKMPALQVVTGMLHGGAKMGLAADKASAYATSRGTHGIGIKGTNFTSKFFEVWSCFNGVWQYIAYKDGELSTPVKSIKKPPLLPHNGKPAQRGTIVHFKPDLAIVGADSFPLTMFAEWARISAYFTDGLTVTLVSHSKKNGLKRRDWHYPEGPTTYVEDRIKELKAERYEPTTFLSRSPLADVILAFTNFDGSDVDAFTNGLRNNGRGVHHSAVLSAMFDAIEPHMLKTHTFTSVELRDGVVGMVNVKLSAPKFGGQTKERLVDERASKPLYAELLKEFQAFFAANKAMTKRICDRCTDLNKLRRQFTMGKQAATAIKNAAKAGLPDKGIVANDTKPEDRELFLAEGDSAIGHFRFTRHPWQEGLPLRGKVMNALRADPTKLIKSETVLGALTMLGYVPDSKDPYSDMRVRGKIILLADPDPDGPLQEGTLVPVSVGPKSADNWMVLPIEQVAAKVRAGEEVHVVSWAHGMDVPVRGRVSSADIVTLKPTDEVVTITFDDKSKFTCTLNHRWAADRSEIVPRRNVSFRGDAFAEDEMQFLPAHALKSGDRIISIDAPRDWSAAKKAVFNPKHSGCASKMVVKVRRHAVNDGCKLFYCLTVPGLHNFALNTGVFSGNCHINSLLLALLYKTMPFVFDKKMVYVCEAPEYYSRIGGNTYAGSSPTEVREKAKAAGETREPEVHHVKGYGELPRDLFSRFVCDPATRVLTRIIVKNEGSAAEFVKVMADSVETRREMMGIE